MCTDGCLKLQLTFRQTSQVLKIDAPDLDSDAHHHRADIFGQLPALNLYTQLSLCFPVTDDLASSAITDPMAAALERLAIHIPWLSG